MHDPLPEARLSTRRRAPRLPRDHFLARPQISPLVRVVRALIVGIVVVAIVVLFAHRHHH
jgi:hypothetical protein